MTTYYVDFVNGSDANNGLGPDASHATNKPWKTVTKLLGAAGMSSGDTAYLSPAGPFRETVSVAMTSPTVETKVLGDPGNQQGFKTSGGVRVSPGTVSITAYTTNDKTTPATTVTINPAGRDFLTFEKITIVGGDVSPSCVLATTTTSTNIKWRDVTFIPVFSRSIGTATTVFGTAFHWLFDRCRNGPTANTTGWQFNGPTGTGSDYDIDVVVQNCLSLAAGGAFALNTSGASANKPGGFLVYNSTFVDSRAFAALTNNTSTSIPCKVENCVILSLGTTGITAGAAGSVLENWNMIYANTPANANVTRGGNSVDGPAYAPLFNFFNHDWVDYAPEPRPWMEPLKSSPALVFGNDGNQPTTDVLGLPRPATALAAAGAYGTRHNTFTRDPSPIGGGGAFALKITGPGDYGFRIPVRSATSYDISYDVQWDATYAGSKPQLLLDANPRIGVAAQTITAVGSSGSPETLTLATVTPTGPDYDFLIVRVVSRDTNGAGVVQSDDLVVA